MKAKIVVLTVLLTVMLLWVFQSASAQDNETTENTEKIKELNQQEKQSLLVSLVRIWDYISNNALLAGVIVLALVALGRTVIQHFRRRVVTVETKELKTTISPAMDGISELIPQETAVKEHIQDGDRFFHEDEFTDSAASYDKAGKTARDLKDEKSSALAFLGLGAARCRQGKYNEAITILTECTNYLKGEALARTYFNRGVAYYELKEYKKAFEDCHKAIQINPQFATAYNNRGVAYGNLKDYEKAIEDFDKAVEINPQDAVAYCNRGAAYGNLKDYEKAIEDFDKAIQINPQDAVAYCNRGAAYCELKDYKKAIEDSDKAIEINPQDAVAYYNRGNAYNGLKEYIKAIGDYDKAIEISPQDAKAYNGRGVAYAELKDYKKAIDDFDKAIEINPQDAKAYNNRGNAYGGLKDYKKAIEDYDKAIELKDKLPDKGTQPYYNLACVYALRKQEGDKERIIKYLKKAIELDDECKKEAKEDEDFKDYWDDPEFKKLVE